MINFTSKKISTENTNSEQRVMSDNSNTVKVKVKRVDTDNTNGNKYDMTGRTFGDYTVAGQDGVDGTHHKLWKCVCNKCGETFKTTSYELTHGRKNTNCTKKDLAEAKDNFDKAVDSFLTNESLKEDTDGDCTKCDCGATTYRRLAPFDTIGANYPDDELVSEDKYHLIYHREVCYDLFNVPFYYKVAYCLPTNMKTYGTTASKLGLLAKSDFAWMKLDYFGEGKEVGTISQSDNIIILHPNKEREIPKTEDIAMCIAELADMCVNLGIEYLAMPRICCGHNGHNWEEIKKLILEVFANVYTEAKEKGYLGEVYQEAFGGCEPIPINITFCYQ